MKDIVIVCAGTYGREALSIIKATNQQDEQIGKEKTYNLLGFVDDNLDAFKGTDITFPILGKISEWKPIKDEVYVIGSAFPQTKAKLTQLLKRRGCKFETLIAPWSRVSDDCKMGEGCFITAHSICAGVVLGDFVNINGSILTPGAVIDDYSTITGFAVVENAKVGKRVFVGSHAVIGSGVRIGDDAQVSVGSIVLKDVLSGSTVFGVPAQEI